MTFYYFISMTFCFIQRNILLAVGLWGILKQRSCFDHKFSSGDILFGIRIWYESKIIFVERPDIEKERPLRIYIHLSVS